MIKSRRFVNEDAKAVSDLVRRTLKETNIKDYSKEYIEDDVKQMDKNFFIERAKFTNCYVFVNENIGEIIGVGSIGSYWGSETESSLFTIFVSPDYQGMGIGKKIMETLESDEYFLRSKRVEIPASITALTFYQKMGYDFKNGVNEVDEEGLYRLEKFR
ncbi:GNAT family N-acetyltransferase [Salinicoccus halodurans]|uniref:GNAT family acetyltransferase n=1 Tax=Salinicoccus halodurans TaxID=407035 RepID=A0A0F7D4Q3_9STAP|nr:GNAT family N-acetyltransferase [Salinicoccus halodurans]AKG74635.1 GNAT family acetyltransferase [Salinicoccus halodurans]SFK88996.1 Ribosomal protein S18 acetylase RimI [Salinicoccus halodurans]